jgi:hypothetical protein
MGTQFGTLTILQHTGPGTIGAQWIGEIQGIKLIRYDNFSAKSGTVVTILNKVEPGMEISPTRLIICCKIKTTGMATNGVIGGILQIAVPILSILTKLRQKL